MAYSPSNYQADSLAAAIAHSTGSSATTQNDSTGYTSSSFTTSQLGCLNTAEDQGMATEPSAKNRKPLPITPNRTPRKPRLKKEGPHKMSGPKIPTPEELVASGIENAAMMDKESGLLDFANLPDFGLDNENEDWLKYDFEEDIYDDTKPIPSEFEPPEGVKTTTKPSSGASTYNKNVTKKGLPLDPNGRFVGRQLVMWHRPRMIEKLILHTQYECHRRGILIPWDHVVHRLCPGSSGQSAIQHLSKLRDVLVSEGHMVPPLLGKVHVKQPPEVRGFIQDEEDDDMFATRIVRWGEKVEDRKVSLAVPGLVRGSGNYRKDGGAGLSRAIKTKDGKRRNRLPVEIQEAIQERVRRRTKKVKDLSPISDESGASDWDGDYEPSALGKKRKYGLRKTSRKLKRVGSESDEAFVDENATSSTDIETPIKKQRKNSVSPQKPKSAFLVKLKISPSKLVNFSPGNSGAGIQVAKDHDIKLEDQDSGNENVSAYCADDTYRPQLSTPDMDIFLDDPFYSEASASSLAGFAGFVPIAAASASNGFQTSNMLSNSHPETTPLRDCTLNTPQRSAAADVFRNMSLNNNGYAGDSFQDIFDDSEDTENIPPGPSYSTTVVDNPFGEMIESAQQVPIIAQFATANRMHDFDYNTFHQQETNTGNDAVTTPRQLEQQLGYTGNANFAIQFVQGLDEQITDDAQPDELSRAGTDMDDSQQNTSRDGVDEQPAYHEDSLPCLAIHADDGFSDWETEYYDGLTGTDLF